MASSSLDELPDGSEVFIDAPIFVYHFTGSSESCRGFLERCERGALQGVTSAVTLAETTHRLMLIEAVSAGLVTPGNVVRKLRERPELVRRLGAYQDRVEEIPLMGIQVEAVDLRTLLLAAGVRRRHGLLTNDSLALATAEDRGVQALASADRDFADLPGVELYRPEDLTS